MMHLLGKFDPAMQAQYDPQHDTTAADTFRATLLVAAESLAFGTDLRQRFRTLNFPISDTTYQQLLAAATVPTLTSVTPARGPAAGGTPIVLRGTNFFSGARVTLAGVDAADVTVLDDTTMTATSPAGTLGVATLQVVNPDRQSASGTFTYAAPTMPAPDIVNLLPGNGPTAGGTTVTMAVKGAQDGALVFFGSRPASTVTWINQFTVRALSPAGTGSVDIRLVNPDGRTALGPVFAYMADTDGDGLPDSWERTYGLDQSSGVGANGATGDPDCDTLTNREEFELGSSPIQAVRYFAEGSNFVNLPGFRTRIALVNPHADVTVQVELDFQILGGSQMTYGTLTLQPYQRRTLDTWSDVPGFAQAEFATVVRSNFGIVADRTMTLGRHRLCQPRRDEHPAPGHALVPGRGGDAQQLQAVLPAAEPQSGRCHGQDHLPAAGAASAGRGHVHDPGAVAQEHLRSTTNCAPNNVFVGDTAVADGDCEFGCVGACSR